MGSWVNTKLRFGIGFPKVDDFPNFDSGEILLNGKVIKHFSHFKNHIEKHYTPIINKLLESKDIQNYVEFELSPYACDYESNNDYVFFIGFTFKDALFSGGFKGRSHNEINECFDFDEIIRIQSILIALWDEHEIFSYISDAFGKKSSGFLSAKYD